MTSERASRLFAEVFTGVYRDRMADMPMVNPELQVDTVGFREWQGGHVGVLITPWCMNLVHLPDQATAVQLSAGAKRRLVFPSGIYEFIGGEEPSLGRYESCSLFSPMFDFPDQATAVATAEEAMEALFSAQVDDAEAAPPPAESAPPDSPPETPANISRRDLLRGVFRRPPESP